MKKIHFIILTFLSVIQFSFVWAEEVNIELSNSYWNLPQALTKDNAQIYFEVDSTWHLVHVEVENVNGKIWLEDPNDFMSIQAKFSCPVKSFNSENSFRDKKMRHVMAEEKFPNVIFKLEQIENLCDPGLITEKTECPVNIKGKLMIRGVEQDFIFPALVSKLQDHYEVHGAATLDWSSYGVEDPSILIAKVEKEVKINIFLKL